MKIKNQRDFFSGLVFMGAGALAGWVAAGLRIGNAARMGQGYFPGLLGAALAVLGGFIAFKSLVVETEDGGVIGAWAVRAVACVVGANVLFALMLAGVAGLGVPPLGLVPAVFAATAVAAFASRDLRAREVLLLAAAAALVAGLVFTLLPGASVPLWPASTAP
jgi:hypothetical protein